MEILEKAANKIRYFTTRKEERGQYSAGYWPGRVRQETIRLCGGLKGSLLEVGCGEGLFLADLANKNQELRISGVDNWNEMVIKARERIKKLGISNVEVSCLASQKLPFLDNSFDVVVCINTLLNLHSINEVIQTIQELSRVVKKGGKVILDIRNSLNPIVLLKYKLAKYYDSTLKVPVEAYRFKVLQDILNDSGLSIKKKSPVGAGGSLLAPIIIIQSEKCKS